MTDNLQQLVIDEFSSDEAFTKYQAEANVWLWHSEKKLIKRFFDLKYKTLDMWCGTGRTTLPMHKMGYDVIGVDITPRFVQYAQELAKQKKLDLTFQLWDATSIDFPDASFGNVLFSFNWWAQIPGKEARQEALQEIYRVLQPWGIFIFTAHNRTMHWYTWLWIKQWFKHYIYKPLWGKIKEIDYWDVFFGRSSTSRFANKQYIHIPTIAEVLDEIKKSGFQVVFCEKRSKIDIRDSEMESWDCVFYVCKK